MTKIKKEGSRSEPVALLLDLEVDLAPYIRGLKWIVPVSVVVGLLFGFSAYFYSKSKKKLFDSTVTFVINEPRGVDGRYEGNKRSSEMMSLVEYGFVMKKSSDNYKDYIFAEMRSRSFTNYWAKEAGVLPKVFAKRWDPTKDSWRSKEVQLSQFQISEHLNKSVRYIRFDNETGLTHVRIRAYDPGDAAAWANGFIEAFNAYMNTKNLEEIEASVKKVKAELKKTVSIEMRNALLRTLEAKTALSVFNRLRVDQILRVVDPGIPNWTPAYPKGRSFFSYGFFTGAIGTFCLLIFRIFVRQVISFRESHR